MTEPYRPRMIVDVTLRQKAFLDTLPIGYRKALIQSLLDDLIDTYEKMSNKPLFIAGIIAGRIGIQDF